MESNIYLIALFFVVCFLFLIYYLVKKFKYSRIVKITIFVLSLILAFPLWYFIQYPIIVAIMAIGAIFPRSNIAPCWMTPISVCKLNPHCEIQTTIGGLGHDSSICVSKPSPQELMPLRARDDLTLCKYYQSEKEYESAKSYCRKAIEEFASVNKNGKYDEQIKEANQLISEM